MTNHWKVLWREGGKFLKRTFVEDKPTEAVAFAKDLKRRGLVVDVVSGRRAYAPPRFKEKGKGIWCPYCIKWRDFDEFSVRCGEVILAPTLRCPVCHISINDAYVRQFNPVIFNEYQILEERRAKRGQASRL